MVELRSRTHLHSIHAIKDGSIKIVSNVVARGKLKLKFRELVDVYNQENTEDDVPIPRAVRDLENDSEMRQGSCTFGAAVNNTTDPGDFSMTLEKIRKQCREKKRKLRSGVDGVSETASQVKVKQEYSTLQTEDGGCDDEEPLSSWNTKFSKRRNKNQERKANCGSTSSPFANKVDFPVFYGVKPEASWDELEIYHVTTGLNMENQTEDEGCDFEKPIGTWNTKLSKKRKKTQEGKTMCGSPSTPSAEDVHLPVFCDVRPETSWDESYSVPETMALIPADSLLDSNKEPECTSNTELVEEIVHDLPKDTGLVIYRSPEPNSPGMVGIEESITEPNCQPEKLLSGRKALSPTSQAKLRKAMEHPDSPEKMAKKSKVKLYFSSQATHRILKAQGLDGIDRVEVVRNPKQTIRKANNNTRQTQYQRSTNKFPRRGTQAAKPQPFSTGRTSLQGCTQKAIAFSEGQMHDFQYVAAKLTKELKSMRQVAKRCLLAESNPSIMSDCNLDEVKTLIGNAEKTEESSKKWLSMIKRDCNRFCKLMSMVEEDSRATENIVQKKKKIKFADDAGGDLCHFKVLI